MHFLHSQLDHHGQTNQLTEKHKGIKISCPFTVEVQNPEATAQHDLMTLADAQAAQLTLNLFSFQSRNDKQ